jgi:hypothetical protein
MAKLLLPLMFALLCISALSAYTSDVHENILNQALEYLSHIAYFDNYSHLSNHDGVNAMLQNAVDEDFGDWIYGYGNKGTPAPSISEVSDMSESVMKGYIKTVTHFWNADMIEPVNSSGHSLVEGKWLGKKYSIENVPSAQKKAQRMMFGKSIHHSREFEFRTPGRDHEFVTVAELKVPSQTINLTSANSIYRICIYSVDDYIKNHNILILGHNRKFGKYADYEIPYYVHLSDSDWNNLMKQQEGTEEFKYLGRLAHLLSDMCVPTHAHNDIHGMVPKLDAGRKKDFDQYEGWNVSGIMGTRGGYLTYHKAIRWTSADVAKVYGYKLIPLPPGKSDEDFLYDLFYTANQVTSMFPSNDVDGNFTANSEHPFSEYPFILEMQSKILEMHGGSAEFQKGKGQDMTPEELENIQSVCMPMAIRAVATLLYWWGNRYGYPQSEASAFK